MGSHFGTSLAKHLDADPSNHLLGVDIEPPRRHLHRARFCLVQPDEGDRVVELLREFEPTAVVHLGVFEPHARSNPAAARTRTLTMTDAVIEVAETCPTVDRIVVRSGIEVYGRGRGTPLRPDEDLAPEPTSGYGRTLWAVEQRLVDAGRRLGTAVARLRFAPVAGPHIPSPVTRYLRLPVVPVALVPDPPFSLLHIDDASDAMVAALARRFDGVVNVVGPGAVTGSQAVRLGGRLPLPMPSPALGAARLVTALAGSPLPDHIFELLVRGRTADGGRCLEALGVTPHRTTLDVVSEMYRWESVTYLAVERDVA
jgi:UDP-glucose 4-epimerase